MVRIATECDLRECLKQIEAIESDLVQLTSILTDAQFHAPPRTGGWSVGYCIEHLVLTGRALLVRWDEALHDAAPTRASGNGHRHYRWWQRKLLLLTNPPYKFKTKTSQAFLPCSRRPMKETVQRFLEMHDEFTRRMESSSGLDLERTKVQSPFASWIRYPLGFSFDLALAHERRHLWQAWQARRELMDQL
jgi:hypothetical protein